MHKGSCPNDTHLFTLAENDADKRILHKGSKMTGCVWLSQMLDYGGTLLSRVGHVTKYTSAQRRLAKPIINFQKRVKELTTNVDGTLKSQYTMSTSDLLTRGAVLENDTIIMKEFYVDGTYTLALAVVTQIKAEDCIGRILIESKPYTNKHSSFAVIRDCEGSQDETIVRIINHFPMYSTTMVLHPTKGTCLVHDTLILPRAPSTDYHRRPKRKLFKKPPLEYKNMILSPDETTWPIFNCMRVTAHWTDDTGQRVHNATIPEAVLSYINTMEPPHRPPTRPQAQPKSVSFGR